MEALTVPTIVLMSANISLAQRKPTFSGSSQSSVTVRLTVESSVGVIQDADGRQHLVVANGPAAADDASQAKPIQLQTSRTSGNVRVQKKIMSAKPKPH